MLKRVLLSSAIAVAMLATSSDAQPRTTEPTCKWNDLECIRDAQERARRERERSESRVYDRDRDGRDDRWERDRDDRRKHDREVRYERERWEHERGRHIRNARFPRMASALAMRNGRGIPGDARPWVGNGPVRVDLTNRDRDRVPERATIHIVGTRETQVWIDRNNDGRADRILFYRNGRLVHDLVR